MSQGPLKIIVYNHKCMVVFPTILENSRKSCQQLLSKLRKGSVGQKYSASAWNEALVVVCIVHHSSRGEGIRLWLHCESGFCVGPGAGAGPRNFPCAGLANLLVASGLSLYEVGIIRHMTC